MLRFLQTSDKAIVKAGDLVPGNWWGASVLNVTVIEIGTLVHMYFRALVGTNDARHAIGCWTQPVIGFDPHDMTKWTDQGIMLEPADIPGIAGTSQRLANPNIIYFGGEYRLYFIIKEDSSTRMYVATSPDGLVWTPVGNCLTSAASFGGGGSGVCVVDTEIWMMSFSDYDGTNFKAVMRKSTDGLDFVFTNNVILPALDNTWRGQSMSTCRLVYEAPYVYALICGSPEHADWNECIGLYRAADTDYTTWTEYAANPVFLRNSCGTQDEAAIWTMAIADVNGTRWAFYEGAGSRGVAGSGVSNDARDTAYSDYNDGTYSQIFATSIPAKAWSEIWTDGDLLPTGSYQIRNMKTLGYLAPVDGATADGTLLATYSDPASTGAVWTIDRLDGFYSATVSSKVAEIGGGNRAEGKVASIYTLGVGTHFQQDWHMVPVDYPRSGAGLYRIINRNSGMCIGADGGDGAHVSQRGYDGSQAQIWRVSQVL